MSKPPQRTLHTLAPGLSYALALAWAGALVIVLELFGLPFFEEGPQRALPLALLATLAFLPARLLARVGLDFGPASWRKAARSAVLILCAAGVVASLLHGLHAVEDTRESGWIRLDQGQIVYRASHMLADGHNPYERRSFLDPAAFTLLVKKWYQDRECVRFAHEDPFIPMTDFWRTLDWSLMAGIYPDFGDSSRCDEARRDFDTIGLNYGPLMLAGYAPFVFSTGKPGVFHANMVHFLILLAISGWLAWMLARGNAFLLLLAFAPLLFTSRLRHDTLELSCADTLPTLVALAGLGLLWSGRERAAAFVAGLAAAVKLAPGLLFWPAMLGLRRRYLLLVPLGFFLVYVPFILWDAAGFYSNIILFNFVRPTEPNALVHFLTSVTGGILKAAAGVAVLLALLGAFRRGWSRRAQLVLLLVVHLGLYAAANIFHNNYLIWILPLLGLYMTAVLADAEAAAQDFNAPRRASSDPD